MIDAKTAAKMYLGQILIDNAVFHENPLNADDFPDAFSHAVFEAIGRVIDSGQPANLVTVQAECGNRNVVPPGDLAALTNEVPTTANARVYADAIRDHAKRRRLARLGRELQERIKSEDLESVTDYLEGELTALTRQSETSRIVSARDRLPAIVDQIEERFHAHGALPGLATGFGTLDDMLLGLQRKRIYYIGARPSQGKSALMLSVAKNLIQAGVRVGIISLESSADEFLTRLLASTSKIGSQQLASGVLPASAFKDLTDAVGDLYEQKLFIADDSNATLSRVRGRIREMVRRFGAQIVFLDYLQLISEERSARQYREHVAECSKALKDLARELDIPIVVLAQLRRDADGRRPTLADFAESGQIERDADVAVLIHHFGEGAQAESALLVEKNRDGRTGSIKVKFNRETVTFSEDALEAVAPKSQQVRRPA